MDFSSANADLRDWSVICLRPAMQQAAMRHQVKARAGRHITLPGIRLEALPATAALAKALTCKAVVFTSPAAVYFAAQQLPLEAAAEQRTFAVGEGTARALARHRIRAIAPDHTAMHSEGVLALPQWNHVHGPVGLVTAPGGRGLIDAGLAARGFDRIRAEVYRRVPPCPGARQIATLCASIKPRAVLISSGEALAGVLDALPALARTILLQSVAVCSSTRLQHLAIECGFDTTITATAPTARAMLDALAAHAARKTLR